MTVRHGTSYITVACMSGRRWFDLDAVRTEHKYDRPNGPPISRKAADGTIATTTRHIQDVPYASSGNEAGAPPLDWWDDGWDVVRSRLIDMMCPRQVCRTCGKPSERITDGDAETKLANRVKSGFAARDGREAGRYAGGFTTTQPTTLGWSDCGHNNWRPGHVLDPFTEDGDPMSTRLLVGDARDRIAEIPDGSVDLVVTSPPFLALRKYGDNDLEMGSEGTPANFLDALLELTVEFRRVLAPHGSIAIELGDTYSGSGGAGGDYSDDGLRAGQPKFRQGHDRSDDPLLPRTSILPPGQSGWEAAPQTYFDGSTRARANARRKRVGGAATHEDVLRDGSRSRLATGAGWPLAKSLALIPQLYPASLAYGHNLLRQPPSAREMLAISRDFVNRQPDASALALHEHLEAWYEAIDLGPAGTFTPWRVRNVITWCRPNPPVGALGDKVRPATSYITVACPSAKRWFDLDAVRTEGSLGTHARLAKGAEPRPTTGKRRDNPNNNYGTMNEVETVGAPPLDWWDDALDPNDPTDHMTIVMPTQPYPGAHYATWPAKLAQRLIDMMCPSRVCTVCGKPSERITRTLNAVGRGVYQSPGRDRTNYDPTNDINKIAPDRAIVETLGWSDCDCREGCDIRCEHWPTADPSCRWAQPKWRPGHVLDPFSGSGTTLAVASGMGRDATGIELYPANADLIRDRVGMFLEEVGPTVSIVDTRPL